MEIEPINSNITGLIKLNYHIRVRIKNKLTSSNIKKTIFRLLNGIEYEYSLLSFNNEDYYEKYQFNLLIKTNCSNLSIELYKNISGKGVIENVKTKILVQVEKPITKKDKLKEFKEEFRNLNGQKFVGKGLDIQIIPIQDKETSNYFVCRCIRNKNNFSGFINCHKIQKSIH